MVYLRDRDEVEGIRAAARLVAMTLDMLGREVRPGVTTEELDRLAESFIRDHGGRPAFKGYRGFPASICPSINDEVVHAIPGARQLAVGDIVGIEECEPLALRCVDAGVAGSRDSSVLQFEDGDT